MRLTPGNRLAVAVLAALFLFLSAPAACSAVETERRDAETLAAAAVLEAAGRWDRDKMRELGERIETLSVPLASRALWLAASAPARVDAITFFANALSSPHPGIRRQAADLMLGRAGDDGRVIINRQLDVETDEETVVHLVEALTLTHKGSPVPMLVDIMAKNESRPFLVSVVAEKLRQVTRENIQDDPFAWRDWWLDNSHRYE